MKKILLFGLLAIIFLTPTKVFAAPPPVPSTLDAGAIDKTNKNGLDLQNYKPLNLKKEVSQPKTIVPQTTTETKDGLVYNPPFELKKVTFSGNSIFSTNELNKYTEKLINKKIYISELFDAVNEISKAYSAKGYLTSYAYVAPQKVSNGTIAVTIIESKIGSVSVEGNKYSKEKYLKNTVLAANGLKEGEIFNVNNIKKSLDIVNEKKHIKGQIAIEGGKKSNYTDIILDVKESYPLSFNTAWDNSGNRLVGRQRNIMLLSQDNLFGRGHSVYGGTVLATGTTGALAGYKMPFGKHGTELQFDYSYANIKLQKEQEANKINGFAHNYNLRLFQPLYKTNKLDISTDLGVGFGVSTSLDNLHDKIINKYNRRAIQHGINLTSYDRTGLFSTRLETSYGLPILGATTENALTGESGSDSATSKFFKLNLNATRLQRLPKNSYGIFKLSSQYSPNKLFAFDQIQMSGTGAVRGFEPAVALGDWGINGTTELRAPVPCLKALLPKKIESINDKIKLGAFYDWGLFNSAHNNYRLKAESNFLQSVGTGIHIGFTKYLTASFEVGIPIGPSIYKSQNAMFLFSIKSDIWDILGKRPKLQTL